MGPVDFFWHLANLFAVGLLFGCVTAVGAKLLWRQPLAGVSLARLAVVLASGACVITVAGLFAFGRDGRMATFGLMVLTAALTLAWLGRSKGR